MSDGIVMSVVYLVLVLVAAVIGSWWPWLVFRVRARWRFWKLRRSMSTLVGVADALRVSFGNATLQAKRLERSLSELGVEDEPRE